MRKKKKRQSKAMSIVVFLMFAAIILIADLCLILMHDRSFSENENRMLQQAPELSVRSLTSGRFMTQAENFVADQFFLRDNWISFKLGVDKTIGKQESNGVYLGKDGYLIEAAVVPNQEDLDNNLLAIRGFAERHEVPMVMTVVPNAVSTCKDLLPAGAPNHDQNVDIDYIRDNIGNKVVFADVRDTLSMFANEPVDAPIYYKSDHHWTSLGAKDAFEAIAPYLQLTELVPSYTILTATNDFSGTMASTSGSFNTKDTIDLYVADAQDLSYVVEYTDSKKKSATIYNSEALATKDKYEVFLGGNESLVTIRTTAASDRSLLIFKDSYANAFVQFLLPYFRSIVIVDPRYYSDDCAKLMSEKEITDVLFLYNMNTFALDNSLAGVLTPDELQ